MISFNTLSTKINLAIAPVKADYASECHGFAWQIKLGEFGSKSAVADVTLAAQEYEQGLSTAYKAIVDEHKETLAKLVPVHYGYWLEALINHEALCDALWQEGIEKLRGDAEAKGVPIEDLYNEEV